MKTKFARGTSHAVGLGVLRQRSVMILTKKGEFCKLRGLQRRCGTASWGFCASCEKSARISRRRSAGTPCWSQRCLRCSALCCLALRRRGWSRSSSSSSSWCDRKNPAGLPVPGSKTVCNLCPSRISTSSCPLGEPIADSDSREGGDSEEVYFIEMRPAVGGRMGRMVRVTLALMRCTVYSEFRNRRN
ncbi:hypothetical protein K402DRAFT_275688 [Aulographum hederae CBS 113979]|uniref:Uncharacterized protein n=1 Tax=Aulographum hederae CBS 113979 TaxID=1176131 RepID=A0A6G1GIC9_9PEZI|nr:hypothetical protein K402DRAFT_275688 [Aulographum hederae CBS 113979]